MAVLGLIPARGGSKGIPGKNLTLLGGKPLLVWTIDGARASSAIDAIVVSSDDSNILDVATKHGAMIVVRPAELSRDNTGMMPVVVHALGAMKEQNKSFDTLVLLQPTSPLRAAQDIDGCIELHRKTRRPVVSVKAAKTNPSWMFSMAADHSLSRYHDDDMAVRRQDLPALVTPNGAIYVMAVSSVSVDASFFDSALGYAMPAERSIDIDEPFDLDLARLLVAAQRNNNPI